MSQIRGKNTGIEKKFRRYLWRRGYRNYRIKNNLPGKPDVYFPKRKITIFIDGCFWHKCPKCYKEPKSNKSYWIPKIERNIERDKEVAAKLKKLGYTIVRFWGHEIRDNMISCIKRFEEIYEKV